MENKVNQNTKIEEILSRSVQDAVVFESLKSKLMSGKKLRVKLGIDPTSPDLHLGHAVVLRKLRAFQDLGHTAVLIIGDFTATIGDPSGKSKTRPTLDDKDIKRNMKEYVKEAGKIIDTKKAEIYYNSKWLKKLSLKEIFKLSSLVSISQILERNDFTNRLKNNESIRMHELFYPLMVSYDSVMIKADIELGGNDQLFNLLAGRVLMERLGLVPQDVITVSLLVGTDGKQKMSKSLGNYIGLSDTPREMYGKIMSVPDELLLSYFNLCTNFSNEEIDSIETDLKNSVNPKEKKDLLAYEITKIYHGEKEAVSAKEYFTKTFSENAIPADVSTIEATEDELLASIFLKSGIVSSKTDFGRLVKGGAITNMGTRAKVTDIFQKVDGGGVYKIGKHRFIKLIRQKT